MTAIAIPTNAFESGPRLVALKIATLLTLLYCAVMWWAMTQPESGPTAFIWPAAGMVIATLCLRPRSEWPLILALVYLGGAATIYAVLGSPAVGLIYMLGDVLEYWIGASLFLLVTNGRTQFDRLQDVTALIATIVGVSAGCSALFGALAGMALFDRSFFGELRIWWVSNATGDILVVPMVLSVAAAFRERGWSWLAELRLFDWLLVIAAFGTIVIVSHPAVTMDNQLAPYLFVALPFLLWLTMRRGLALTTVVIFIGACIAYSYAVARLGPTARTYGNLAETAVQLQAAIACFSASCLYLGATLASRARLSRQTARISAELAEARKLEAIGAVSGGVAHDFNNILFAVDGYTEMLADALKSGGDQEDALRSVAAIQQVTRRGRSLVDQIFSLTRPGTFEPGPVPVAPIVDDVIALYAPRLVHGVAMRRTGIADAVVVGVEVQLHQVLMNLVSNSVKATVRGEIVIDIARIAIEAPRPTLTGVIVPGNYVLISVRDTGVGIDPLIEHQVLEPFFSAARPGTGLGMTVVTRNVKAHGGGLEIESRQGTGTAVRVYLPAVRDDGNVPPERAEHGVPPGRGQTVIVVDDDRNALAMHEELLARAGYEPVGFDDAQQALRALASTPYRFDVIVSDSNLEGLSGLDLIGRMRRHRPDLPAVLVSAVGSLQLAREASVANVLGPIVKPPGIGEFARALESVLPRTPA